jgi:hypothetical protein
MAAGDVVNTAARLQTAASLGEILIGEQTAAAIQRAIELDDERAVEAKGKAVPVQAWPVLRARARPQVERVHGVTLVGRERELALLSGALDRARQERSLELVTLVGVPGIGKSRLVLELYAGIEAEAEITSWRSGRCLAYGEGITFWALGEMVKAEAGILEGDSEAETERKLRAVVDDPWIESHLRPLVGLQAGRESGGDRREEAFTAWRRFFERLAEERPLVLVFEDLHWADDDLLDFVDHLTDWATGVPLLVVCTTRPELLARRPNWGGGKPNALTISLTALSDAQTTKLLGDLLERALLPAELQAELLANAGGNPLYAEEFARMARERGRIEQLPATVQGLIAARLDLLESEQKELVQDAAVIGRSFWLVPLADLSGSEPAALEQQLHALERKEFVRRERSSSVAGDAEYAFRHVLVRDIAYGQIPRADRAAKHLGTAAWIERLGRHEDHAEMLAHHYLQALELGAASATGTAVSVPALAALSDAGDRASALSAHAAASRYYRAALELLLPGDTQRPRLLLKLGYAMWFVGDSSLGLLHEAADGMCAAGDSEGAAEAETRFAEQAWLDGERQVARDHLDRALGLLESQPPSRVKALAISLSSRFKMLNGEDEDAIRVGLEALTMAEELGLGEIRAATLNNIGTARSSLGDPSGLHDLVDAAAAAETAGAPYELCRAKGNLASQLWVRGRTAEATAEWEDTGRIARRYGQAAFERWVRGVLIVPHYTTGRWDEASAGADAFIADLEGGRPHYLASQAYSCRALLRLARNADGDALADCEQALATAARAGDRQALLPTLARVAHVRFELGDADGATEAADGFLADLRHESIGYAESSLNELAWATTSLGRGRELVDALEGHSHLWAIGAKAFADGDPVGAAEIAAEIGAVADEAYARLAAARKLARQGRRAEADEQLRRALAFYRGVGATRWVREGESLLAATA